MSLDFQRRFEGKKSTLSKKGITGMVQKSRNPINKQNTLSNLEENLGRGQSTNPNSHQGQYPQSSQNGPLRRNKNKKNSSAMMNSAQNNILQSHKNFSNPRDHPSKRSLQNYPNNQANRINQYNQRQAPIRPMYANHDFSAQNQGQNPEFYPPQQDHGYYQQRPTQAGNYAFFEQNQRHDPLLQQQLLRQNGLDIARGSPGNVPPLMQFQNRYPNNIGQVAEEEYYENDQGYASTNNGYSRRQIQQSPQPKKNFFGRGDSYGTHVQDRGSDGSLINNDSGYKKSYAQTDNHIVSSIQSKERRGRSYVPSKSAGGQDTRSKYTPYSIHDYNRMQKTTNFKLGGLGANFGDKWRNKSKKVDKAKEYAQMVKELNTQTISRRPTRKVKPPPKNISTREKAMAFARTIKKPRKRLNSGISKKTQKKETGGSHQNPKKQGGNIDNAIDQVEGDLMQLEEQHLNFKTKIEEMKKNSKKAKQIQNISDSAHQIKVKEKQLQSITLFYD